MKKARDNRSLVATAHGFERYAFGPDIVFWSSSWKEAERKIAEFLSRRSEHNPEAAESYYSAGCELLWREYQLLFMCQFLEFKLAEFIGGLQERGRLKTEFVSGLKQSPRADPERAMDARRITSPASLLVDFGCTLGQLVKILEAHAVPFAGRVRLVKRLNSFNGNRIAFVHHSFGGQKRRGYRSALEHVTAALDCGSEVLRLLGNVSYRLSSKRKRSLGARVGTAAAVSTPSRSARVNQ